MQLLDLTLATHAENLALDEALLDEAESAAAPREVLRLWEPAQTLVVIGRASQVEVEVNRAACQARGVPVFRRTSGGAAIVSGRGCLMYAVVLSYELRPQLRMIDHAHALVLDTLAGAIARHVPNVLRCGISDLAIDRRLKFSGNSLRCRRTHLLYHGTLLYDFPLQHIADYLGTPPRQPEYRAGRGHLQFVTNLPIAREEIRRAVVDAWRPEGTRTEWPQDETMRLAAEKYSADAWNLRR